MTATLEDIHRDPAILDRAISRREALDIVSDGEVTATLLPKAALSAADARRLMQARFDAPNWEFSVGVPMSRDERNALADCFLDTNVLLYAVSTNPAEAGKTLAARTLMPPG